LRCHGSLCQRTSLPGSRPRRPMRGLRARSPSSGQRGRAGAARRTRAEMPALRQLTIPGVRQITRSSREHPTATPTVDPDPGGVRWMHLRGSTMQKAVKAAPLLVLLFTGVSLAQERTVAADASPAQQKAKIDPKMQQQLMKNAMEMDQHLQELKSCL